MIEENQIRETIRESVHRITGIAPAEIHETSSYREDLGLDSLSALEVVIDLEYAFKIKVPEERIQTIRNVQDTIDVVQEYLSAPARTA
ncbi:MAG TPA: acyl carrier protein [Vicinamibacterales bacterium]|nr:acyl carrier protein [Vicinamibacterales bacterium]